MEPKPMRQEPGAGGLAWRDLDDGDRETGTDTTHGRPSMTGRLCGGLLWGVVAILVGHVLGSALLVVYQDGLRDRFTPSGPTREPVRSSKMRENAQM